MDILSFAPIYIVYRIFYELTTFFRHWYIDSFYNASRFARSLFNRMDRTLAIRVTLQNIAQPLYQDYTFLGYFLGFIFRSARLFIGAIIYAIFFGIFLVFYGAWLALPFILTYEIILSLSSGS